ncbi:MAG: VCBS repeat-containing protein [Acidobacteria bacterium]|nr:VCBS repeat-containing protein [Acidobacteriota bacterium]
MISDVGGYGKCAAGMSNADLDGDMSTDLTIFRPAGATGTEWWTLRSSTGGNWAAQFGDPTDKIVAEDFTGDGKTDVAIFRPSNSNWYILRSEDYSYYSFPFGTTGDIAVPADYDGDGLADPAVYRPSTGVWYIARSTGGLGQERFGFPTDKPGPGRLRRRRPDRHRHLPSVERPVVAQPHERRACRPRSAMTPTTTSPAILPATARRTSPSSGRPTTTGTSSEARTTLTIPSRSARPAISRPPATLTATPSSTPRSSVRPTANGT